MFSGFEPARRDQVFERRRGVSYLLAIAIYLAAGGYGLFLHHEKGKQVDVLLEPEIKDFVAEEVDEPEPEIEEEEAPPPPPEAPPPPKPKKKAPPKPAPKLPDAIPDGPPAEQDTARSDKEYGTGAGGTGTAKTPPKPKAEKPKPKVEKPKPKSEPKAKIDPTKPIDRPERSTPPKPDAGNKTPEYPKELRDQGVEGQIVVKLHISNDGSVKGMKILRKTSTATGDEAKKKAEKLFLKSVVAAVKTWKYTPCKYQGQAISVWIPVTVPFKLKAG
jgi:protein TonB